MDCKVQGILSFCHFGIFTTYSFFFLIFSCYFLIVLSDLVDYSPLFLLFRHYYLKKITQSFPALLNTISLISVVSTTRRNHETDRTVPFFHLKTLMCLVPFSFFLFFQLYCPQRSIDFWLCFRLLAVYNIQCANRGVSEYVTSSFNFAVILN